ncbi:MAG: sugar ABC transporter permease [Lachnospiraceae bacterium]
MRQITPYLFITPAVIALAALVVYPLLYGMYISLFETNLANKWNFVGIKNYISIFSDSDFFNRIWITLKFTFLVIIIHFILGIILGIALNRKGKTITFFRVILILPWLMPDVVVALIFKWLLNPLYGLINNTLLDWGIIETNISWLSDEFWAFFCIVAVAVWKGYPLVMVNVLAALQSVSADIYEAAKVDGAGGLQTLFRVILPSIKPVLTTTLILDTVWWFKHYTIIQLLTKGGPGNDTSIISIEIYKQAFEYFKYGKAAAISVVVFLICLLITKLYRRFLEGED